MEPDRCLIVNRGSRARTRDLWFWRPPLYQLSYTPRQAIPKDAFDGHPRGAPLLGFPMLGVLAAARAVLPERQAVRIVLLVLGGRVVAHLAVLTRRPGAHRVVAGHV